MTHDYILTNGKVPWFLNPKKIESGREHDLLRDEVVLEKISEHDVPAKKLIKNYIFIKYDYQIISDFKKEDLVLIYRIKDRKHYDITESWR